jgi:hypothetical protein
MQAIKNSTLVTTLAQILPDQRSKLTQGLLWKLRLSTGFTYTDMFRKCVTRPPVTDPAKQSRQMRTCGRMRVEALHCMRA